MLDVVWGAMVKGMIQLRNNVLVGSQFERLVGWYLQLNYVVYLTHFMIVFTLMEAKLSGTSRLELASENHVDIFRVRGV